MMHPHQRTFGQLAHPGFIARVGSGHALPFTTGWEVTGLVGLNTLFRGAIQRAVRHPRTIGRMATAGSSTSPVCTEPQRGTPVSPRQRTRR